MHNPQEDLSVTTFDGALGAPAPAPLRAWLGAEPALHLYTLGDLDAPFWARTRVWAGAHQGQIVAALAHYRAPAHDVLMAMARPDDLALPALILRARAALPSPCHLIATASALAACQSIMRVSPSTAYLRMRCARDTWRAQPLTTPSRALTPADAGALDAFFAAHYPERWFDPSMLALPDTHVGLFESGELVAVAGVHVFAPTQRVCALGNIAVHRDHRGRGLGREVTAALMRKLAARVDHLGLNVLASNTKAQRCYHALGFEVACEFAEASASAR